MRYGSAHQIIWGGFKVAGLSLMQVTIFVLLYEASVGLYIANFGVMQKVFGFGMQVSYGMWLLSILAGLNSMSVVFAEKSRVRLAVTVGCSAIWILFWWNIADTVPNRFSLISLLGVLGLFSGMLLTARSNRSNLP